MTDLAPALWALIIVVVAVLACGAGVVIAKRNLLPMRLYRSLRNRLFPRPDATKFALRIARGDSPLDVSALDKPGAVSIGPEAVSDLDALLVADPFLLNHREQQWIFFEAMRRDDRRGVIAAARVNGDLAVTYHGIVLEESFHLSYPQVFEHDGEIWMLPESARNHELRLYRATRFPDGWICVKTLFRGHRFVDSTLFQHGGRWWMFTTTNNMLHLYFAEDLLGPWHSHPANPLRANDARLGRCGGRVVAHENRLYRIAQDGTAYYGHSLRATEIITLDEQSFEERELEHSPILAPRKGSWRPFGCHHLDAAPSGNGWTIVSDGF